MGYEGENFLHIEYLAHTFIRSIGKGAQRFGINHSIFGQITFKNVFIKTFD